MIRSHGPRSRAWHVPLFTTAVCLACLVLLALVGCSVAMPGAAGDAAARGLKNVVWKDWSPPELVGPPISLPDSLDAGAFLSRDGLTLYFHSDRAGGAGLSDIWFSKRDSVKDPWGDPVNLAVVNSAAIEQAPCVSNDEHLLFFASSRDGSFDIWMSRRANPNDDSCWGPPEKLEVPRINTDENQEAGPFFLQRAEEGPVNLYFNRSIDGSPNAAIPDIYRAAISRNGKTLINPEPVTELNTTAGDAAVSIRRDGLEIFFFSNRGGNQDLYTATRESVLDKWSDPVNLAALNTASAEIQPKLSWDGTTLFFASNRLVVAEGDTVIDTNIWMSTREKIGRE